MKTYRDYQIKMESMVLAHDQDRKKLKQALADCDAVFLDCELGMVVIPKTEAVELHRRFNHPDSRETHRIKWELSCGDVIISKLA